MNKKESMPRVALDSRRSSSSLWKCGILALLCALGIIWHTNLHVVHSIDQNLANRPHLTTVADQRQSGVAVKDEHVPRKESLVLKHDPKPPRDSEVWQEMKPTSHHAQPKFHIVFSTGCSIFQDWQSYTLFYFAMASGQPGQVTRVASGCSPSDAQALREQFAEQIQSMVPNQGRDDQQKFHLHITPEYSKAAGNKKDYKFFNKPMGLWHWMEEGLGFPNTSQHNDTIFVILDPDQIILRPFVADYTNEQEIWHPKGDPTYVKVNKGQPMAAEYGFGSAWRKKINISGILNSTTLPSPVRQWTDQDIMNHYIVGPPYMAVGADMYPIVKTWAEFVVPIYLQTHGEFLAEMWAYSTAAAHLGLPHQIVKSFMISDPDAGPSEPWSWIDDKTSSEVCSLDFESLPHVFHFCQRYFLGPYFFGKYKVPKNLHNDGVFLSCEHPLFDEPTSNLTDSYNSSITPDGTVQQLNPKQRKRMTFALCQMIPRMNQVATYFKQKHCTKETANLDKSFFFPKDKK